jgi:hypothetical protein
MENSTLNARAAALGPSPKVPLPPTVPSTAMPPPPPGPSPTTPSHQVTSSTPKPPPPRAVGHLRRRRAQQRLPHPCRYHRTGPSCSTAASMMRFPLSPLTSLSDLFSQPQIRLLDDMLSENMACTSQWRHWRSLGLCVITIPVVIL